MNIQAVVERLGFRPPEARVYVALVGLHEATVSDLARKVNMPRTTVQGIVEELQIRGLVNFYTARRRKLWSAEHPRKLLTRHQELEKHLSEVIPALEKMRIQKAPTSKVLSMEGKSGIKCILDDVLAKREIARFLGNLALIASVVGEQEWSRFLTASDTALPGIRLLGVDSIEGTMLGTGKAIIRMLTDAPPVSGALIVLYGSTVVSMVREREEVLISRQEHHSLATLFTEVFDAAWKNALK